MSCSAPARRRIGAAAALVTGAALVLTACASEPVAGWTPPAARVVPGVTLAAPAQSADGATREGADPGTDGADPAAVPAAILEAASLGLVGGRLRNDALPLAARFVYIPGAPAFNEQVTAMLWSAIAATGQPYAPQAHPVESGLAERGCVPGSAAWPASEVLSRPETGPAGGSGTAITCELTGAFGSTIAVTLRTVTGGPAGVTGDEKRPLYVDVASGAVTEGVGRWNESAPVELWQRAVDLLRQQAGGLSSAPVAGPDEAQTAIADEALDRAAHEADGAMRVTLPAGLVAAELAGLGIPATEEPVSVLVDAQLAQEWSTAAWRALAEQASQPFLGVAASPGSVPVDCALIPCVALTYDDGPSGYTPQLLDTLAREQASATFFMLGQYAASGADTVRRVAAEGHEIGSHSMSHPDLTRLSAAAARAQVRDAATILEQISGAPVTTFRPPYGAVNGAVIEAVGMPAILWSVDTNDWRVPGVAALFDRAVNGVAPGGIVLFHDTHADSVAAAGDIIVGLRNRGFEPVTVTELFGGSVPLGRVSAR